MRDLQVLHFHTLQCTHYGTCFVVTSQLIKKTHFYINKTTLFTTSSPFHEEDECLQTSNFIIS